jgi:ABC-type uncharacterized transport system permease subunit
MIAGMLTRAAWGMIAGALKTCLNVNEIHTTNMMNAIAVQFMNYLLSGPLMDPVQIEQGSFIPQTARELQIKAAGQNPAAADSLGINIKHVRCLALILDGSSSGAAGASLSIALLNVFQMYMTAAMGFIAVALVYFGGWRSSGVLVGSLLFSLVNALQNRVQMPNIPIPSDFAVMMSYVLTIPALIFAVCKVN